MGESSLAYISIDGKVPNGKENQSKAFDGGRRLGKRANLLRRRGDLEATEQRFGLPLRHYGRRLPGAERTLPGPGLVKHEFLGRNQDLVERFVGITINCLLLKDEFRHSSDDSMIYLGAHNTEWHKF